jgi:3',5'-cyclic AMP phosphodiesterase CpdA
MTPVDDVRQLIIIHLSDVHFGGKHRFDPPATPGGDVPQEREFPTLLEKLAEDLTGDDPDCPVLFALTGDMAESGAYDEFKKAEAFVRGLTETSLLGRPRPLEDVFIVPGNHDVLFAAADLGERWQQWTEFHNRLRGTQIDREKPWECDVVEDRVDDLGAVIVTLNSAVHVQKGEPAQDRGQVDLNQLQLMQERLEAFDPERLRSAIRVALIHHHPVLIPDLAEPGRGYDAVHNSAPLLRILRSFGFHVLLHGHKHNPHVFTEDTASAFRTGERHPLLIAAGGSAGSTGLPTSPRCGNCYNRVLVKWNPSADQTRIRTTTRGLRVMDDDGADRLPGRWGWETLRVDDRQFLGGEGVPSAGVVDLREFDDATDAPAEDSRGAEYRRLRFHFPVAAVMPSLEPGQVNEAHLWIKRHPAPEGAPPEPRVVRVTWSAGPRFPVISVAAEDDPNLCAVLHYWGPMLVQAHMEFADGETADAHVYVGLPEAVGPA